MPRALAQLLTDLFGRTRLHRIEARTAVDNLGSQRVLEGLGFRREGLLRAYFQLDGRWIDNYLFALVKEEWEARRGSP
jgi:ribosomal-protein-alanine N-acetyltransferase